MELCKYSDDLLRKGELESRKIVEMCIYLLNREYFWIEDKKRLLKSDKEKDSIDIVLSKINGVELFKIDDETVYELNGVPYNDKEALISVLVNEYNKYNKAKGGRKKSVKYEHLQLSDEERDSEADDLLYY